MLCALSQIGLASASHTPAVPFELRGHEADILVLPTDLTHQRHAHLADVARASADRTEAARSKFKSVGYFIGTVSLGLIMTSPCFKFCHDGSEQF